MNERSHLGSMILYHMQKHSWNQVRLEAATGVTQATLSRIISKLDYRPLPPTLSAICHCWPDEESNVRVLVGRLKDEIRLAGHGPESIDLRPRISPSQVDSDAELIQTAAHEDVYLAAMLNQLANLVRRAQRHRRLRSLPPEITQAPTSSQLAAEPPATYDPKPTQRPRKPRA